MVTAAQLAASTQHTLSLSPGTITKRYIGAYYNVGGTTPTVTVTAFLQPTDMVQQTRVYANAYTIS